ncbi:MAG: nickel-dependent hydrogenase large subunit [candidate division Zixibacteria bacterium]|nr:nickel-dependent hydrogenase large subunit [candidate division Zixibacteria bacterium]
MTKKIIIDPITRIEGHLKIEVEVEGGKVTDARTSGEMFRGWEIILKDRNPLDAQMITQRICGVCPSPHAQASTLCLDDAFGVHPPDNGRIIRNLLLASNLIQSHILHFYHLSALDFVDITAILKYTGNDPGLSKLKAWAKDEVDFQRPNAVAPFLPRYKGDYIEDTETNIQAIAHYVKALDMTKKAHEMLCIFGGRMPHEIAIMPGGACEKPTVDKITSFLYRLKELQSFIDNVYIPDVIAVAKAYPKYFGIGKGCGNLLSYGVYEENVEGTKKYFSAGTYIDGKLGSFDPSKIAEYVKYSRFSSGTGLHPSKGETTPQPDKKKAYSWVKAPRYEGKPMEVGPLARMVIEHLKGENPVLSKMVNDTLGMFNAPVNALFSVLGRHATRALECKLVADKCAEWVMQLDPSKPVHTKFEIPDASMGMGLTEGPRGALGHWITIKDKKIDNYQAVVPTTWNAGPRDDRNQPGPMEQALIGTPVADLENPIEPARVVRSFDPCLACAIHIIEPQKDIRKFRVV